MPGDLLSNINNPILHPLKFRNTTILLFSYFSFCRLTFPHSHAELDDMVRRLSNLLMTETLCESLKQLIIERSRNLLQVLCFLGFFFADIIISKPSRRFIASLDRSLSPHHLTITLYHYAVIEQLSLSLSKYIGYGV